MASTGTNKLEDAFRSKGTNRLAPYGGVISGAVVGAVTAAAGVVTIPVGAGEVLIDNNQYTLAAGSIVSAALPNGVNNLEAWVIPVRKSPDVAVLPTVGVEGDIVLLTSKADDNLNYLQEIYVYRAALGGFVKKNEYATIGEKDSIFAPNTDTWGHLPYSEYAGAVLSASDEKGILYRPNTGLPAQLSPMRGAPSYARYAAGFKIADIKVTLTAGAIAVPATDLKVTRVKYANLKI